jgi:hypothetical protein
LILYAKLAESNIKSAINFDPVGGCVPNVRVFSVVDTLSRVVEYNLSLDSEFDDALSIRKLFGVTILPDTATPVDTDRVMCSACRGIVPSTSIGYAVICTLGLPAELDILYHVLVPSNAVPITGGLNGIYRGPSSSNNTSKFNPTSGFISKDPDGRALSNATLCVVEYNRTRHGLVANAPSST